MDRPDVSVIMPVYNEESYIRTCLDSLLEQDYPKERMEWLFVDGLSHDQTPEILRNYQLNYPKLIRILNNPDRTVPYAMNIGIRHATGNYLIRLDAHAEYPRDYLSKCVYYLDNTDADNVGGLAETKGRGEVGSAIAKMLSSRFGVGNSQFRTSGKSGYVDTVPFGAFRREVFEKWGLFDERLTRNQDNELNYRIRKHGGKIYLSDQIRFSYYCRDSFPGIAKMALKNGKWNVITMKLCPGSMGIRHFVPLAFVASVIGLPTLSLLWHPFLSLFTAEMLLYLGLDLYVSLKLHKSEKELFLLLCLFPVFHITYGLGSLAGLLELATGKWNKR